VVVIIDKPNCTPFTGGVGGQTTYDPMIVKQEVRE
jgi:hypothetical protein